MQAIVTAAVPPGDVASALRHHLQTLDPVLAPGPTERMEALLAAGDWCDARRYPPDGLPAGPRAD